MFWIFLIIGCALIILFVIGAIIRSVTLKRYNKEYQFGYNVKKEVTQKTGIPVLDEILMINPNFMSNGLERTNLASNNRVDKMTNQPISLAETLKRYPEEKVRLGVYLKCLKHFGPERVDIEFPIQLGSKRGFLDVVVFAGDKPGSKMSKEHTVLNLQYIFECKKDHPNPNNLDAFGNPETMQAILKSGYNQLTSYMSVCPNLCEKVVRDASGNATTKLFGLGCLTNGSFTKFYKKTTNNSTGRDEFVAVTTPTWYN